MRNSSQNFRNQLFGEKTVFSDNIEKKRKYAFLHIVHLQFTFQFLVGVFDRNATIVVAIFSWRFQFKKNDYSENTFL